MRSQRRLVSAKIGNPNTFIGGVSSYDNSANSVADRLGISISDIDYFGINGNDIEVGIINDYELKDRAYGNSPKTVTHFHDLEGKCVGFNELSFTNCDLLTDVTLPKVEYMTRATFKDTGLTEIEMPELLSTDENSMFQSCPNLTTIKLPKLQSINPLSIYHAFTSSPNITRIEIPVCLTLGPDYTSAGLFSGLTSACTLVVPSALSTINGGAEHGQIAHARSLGVTIIYV